MITDPSPTHWWDPAVVKYLLGILGSVLGFLGGWFGQWLKKRLEDESANKKNFNSQVKSLRGYCDAARESRVQLARIISDYAGSKNPDIPRLTQQYQQIATELADLLEQVKKSFPDRILLEAVQKENGMREYNRLWKAVQDLSKFAKMTFDQIAKLTPKEREEKLAFFDSIKDPFPQTG